MNATLCLRLAAISGFLTVALGAFGAHTLKTLIEAERLAIFETGVRYQMYHALALFGIGVLMSTGRETRASHVAAWGFVVGTLIFSGTLYGLALSGIRWLGAITPIGGVAFLIGWASLVVGASGSPKSAMNAIESP